MKVKSVLPLFALCLVLSLFGQEPQPVPAAAAGDDLSAFQAINASIDTVLAQYEQLTGKVLIKDSNLSANALPITISVPTPVPRAELVRLIEAALLLNNFALIPGPEPNTVKVININTGKNPRSEGVKLYASPDALPEGESIVSYYMPFKFISANEALAVFQTHILPRAFTSFVPINSAQALLITETTSVIRELIGLQQLVDVPPAKVVTEFIQLQRADAERVAETINKLIENQQKQRNGGGAAPAGAPPPGEAPAPVSTGFSAGGGYEGSLVVGGAQVIPDTRTNRILVVTRPSNFAYLKTLVQSFDEAVGLTDPLEYRLRFISAGEVLPVLADLLAESPEEGGAQIKGQQPQQPGQQQTGQTRGVSLGGISSRGAGGISGTGTGSSGSYSGAGSVGVGQDLLEEPNQELGPQSVIVGKTRIISDAKDNKILVIGPPESLDKVKLILDRLDRRPQQVYLATVIGQLNLTNDFQFGVDWGLTYRSISGDTGVAGSNLNGVAPFSNGGLIEPSNILRAGSIPNSVSGLALYGSIAEALRVFVRATDSQGDFKVLARPAVYTANNKRAVISSGQRVPVPQSTLSEVDPTTTAGDTASVASTVTYEDVELRLEVIPLINATGDVTLKIAQINDTLSGTTVNIGGNQVPQINSQRLTTTVTVPSGSTIVLGGLIQDNITETNGGIPYLRKIPYLGKLFSTTTKTRDRNELLIFIQPTVVRDDRETLKQSLREELRTSVGRDTSELAHPTDYAEPVGTPRPRKAKKGKD
jgi:type II secretion system protein D